MCLFFNLSYQTLVSYEGFDYPEGNLEKNNGGSGWQEAWKNLYTNGNDPGNQMGSSQNTVISPGLDYSPFSVKGNAASLQQSGSSPFISYRRFSSPIDLQSMYNNKQSLWVSFLMQGNYSDSIYSGISFVDGSNLKLFLGKMQNTNTIEVGLSESTTAQLIQGSTLSSTNDTQPLVYNLQYLRNNNNQGYLKVDIYSAQSVINSSPIGTYNIYDISRSNFSGIQLVSNSPTGIMVDEIRFGTEWTDIIPEPTTMTTLVVAILMIKRKKAAKKSLIYIS